MKKKIVYLAQVIIFLFLLIYFTQISPLQPFDGDDWRYIGNIRPPFPMWGAWNPTRVLAEVLMPIGGYIGAFIVYTISGNYIWSLSVTEAVIVSIFIIAMLFLFYNFLFKRFNLSNLYALAGEIIFFISCFLLFKHLNTSSYTFFWTVDLSCDFYYLIPGLLNASVILFILQYDDFVKEFRKFSDLKKGLFILAVYFSIFSSTQLSIILATFSFLQVVQILLSEKHLNQDWQTTFVKCLGKVRIYLVILIVWLVSLLFELSGQRASNRTTMVKGTLTEKLNGVFAQFKTLLSEMNSKILICFALMIILFVIFETYQYFFKQRSSEIALFLKVAFGSMVCLLLSLTYLFLAYIKAGSEYVSRPDAMWAPIFFFLFLTNLSFIFIFRNINFVKMLLPLVITLGSVLAFNFNYPPKYPNNANHDAKTVRNVNNYILNQIVLADKHGKSKVTVKVPLDDPRASSKFPASNWPHPYAMARYLQDTLYNHHITRTRMQIIFKPDKSVNDKLYENSKHQQQLTPLEQNYF